MKNGLRVLELGLLIVLTVSFGSGCRRSDPPAPAQPQAPAAKPTPPVPQTIARVHWLGKHRLAGETNAATFMAIWNLPESRKLESQTLDKLAAGLERLVSGLKGETANATRSPAARSSATPQPSIPANAPQPGSHPAAIRFRPLLEDLLQQEGYLEVRQAGTQPGEMVLALRLDESRAAAWETNTVSALEAIPGAHPLPTVAGAHRWAVPALHSSSSARRPPPAPPQTSSAPQSATPARQLDLARSGDWTLLGLAPAQNGLLTEFAARIQRDQAPFPTPAANYWIEADLAPKPLATAFGLDGLGVLPRLSFSATGDGAWVHSSLNLALAEDPKIVLEPWLVPTNFIYGYLSSFTAVRGIAPFLASFKPWNDLHIGPPPNQTFAWALLSVPTGSFFAALQPDASNQVARVADLVVQQTKAAFGSNIHVKFTRSYQSGGLEWAGLPIIAPFLRPVTQNGLAYALGGLLALAGTNTPLPREIIRELQSRTNLLAYDWEATRQRISQWIYTMQGIRMVFGRAQLPPHSSASLWLTAIEPKLGPTGTEVFQIDPLHISLKRKSSLGLTAIELHLLADWLESPSFPRGLHSSLPSEDLSESPPNASGGPPAPPGRKH